MSVSVIYDEIENLPHLPSKVAAGLSRKERLVTRRLYSHYIDPLVNYNLEWSRGFTLGLFFAAAMYCLAAYKWLAAVINWPDLFISSPLLSTVFTAISMGLWILSVGFLGAWIATRNRKAAMKNLLSRAVNLNAECGEESYMLAHLLKTEPDSGRKQAVKIIEKATIARVPDVT